RLGLLDDPDGSSVGCFELVFGGDAQLEIDQGSEIGRSGRPISRAVAAGAGLSQDQARGNSSAGQESAIGPSLMVAAGIEVDLRKLKNIQSILLQFDPPVRPGLRHRGACLRFLSEERVCEYPEGDETMGKGDRRSKRGKLFRGTFGKRRVRASNQKKK